MKSKLIAIIGVLIVGLIGAAGVGCYDVTENYCALTGDEVGYFELPCGQYATAYATSDWDGVSETESPEGEAVNVHDLNYCTGPAMYYDYCTDEEVDQGSFIDYDAESWYTVLGGPC